MKTDEAYRLIEAAISSGKTANGYIISGNVRREGMALALKVLKRLFCENAADGEPCGACDACRHVDERLHPDIHWLMPEMKSRVISVASVREKLLDPMEKTALLGGWKAGVIAFADCMNDSSANAFLKMLEEPTPKTVFLLLTDSPDQLLPTIVSRCQSVDVSDGERRELGEPWKGRVLDILADEGITGVLEKCAAAGSLAAVLGELAKEAEKLVDEESAQLQEGAGERLSEEELNALYSSRYREFRADFVQTILGWFRDMMAVKAGGEGAPVFNADRIDVIRERAAMLTLAQCFRNIEAVDELAAAFGRNIQEEPLLARFTDRVSFGTEGAA